VGIFSTFIKKLRGATGGRTIYVCMERRHPNGCEGEAINGREDEIFERASKQNPSTQQE
jgi:hypothetical protein